MVLEVGDLAEEEEGLVEGHNLEEGGLEEVGPMEAAQTDQGIALEEEVYHHEEAQPEVGAGLGLEEVGQEGQEVQGDQEGVVGDPAYHQESVVVAHRDQGDQGSDRGLGVRGTCPCPDSPWGTHETLQGAQLYLLQTSALTGCLSFYETASQTGSETVCYMA